MSGDGTKVFANLSLPEYLLMGILASGGGAIGNIATAPRVTALEVKIEALQGAIDTASLRSARSADIQREEYRELERRVDALEARLPLVTP